MSVPTNNPVAFTYTSPDGPANTGSTKSSIPHPPSISKRVHTIAGIQTTIYGLAELSPSCTEVAVLWLLHPRLQTEACMAPFAAHFISNWNDRVRQQVPRGTAGGDKTQTPLPGTKGLIAVGFDQRNHGTREVNPRANEAWRSKNESHAQDMFSSYHGSALDTSLLLDYLAAYIFPVNERQIVQNIVMGVSLGGHAAWHVLMQDPRFSAAIVTIGCPDYERLMSDRARLSKRKSWLDGQGRDFVGSKDFPSGLVDAVSRYDPAGLLFGQLDPRKRSHGQHVDEFCDAEKSRLLPVLSKTLGNKRVLNLSGGADKLVPYAMGKPFLDWLKRITGTGGLFEGGGFHFEDVIIPGAGHEVPPDMVVHMDRFLTETLENETEMTVGKKGRRDSRI